MSATLALEQVVTSVTRLLWCAFADGTDEALRNELERTESAARGLTRYSLASVTVLYCEQGIYVNETLWDADAKMYDLALRVGNRLRAAGYNLVALGTDVGIDDLRLMLGVLDDGVESAVQASTREAYSAAARLRSVSPSLVDDDYRTVAHSRRHASHLYASAVVQCRLALRALNRDRQFDSATLEVVGHRIVGLVLQYPDTAVALTRIQIDEVATRSTNTALLAVSACRQVTNDVVALRRVALASMMLESGVSRLAASNRAGEQPDLRNLSEQQAGQVPAATAAAVSLLGWLEPGSLGRAVCAFEAAWRIIFGSTDALYREDLAPRFESLLIWAAWSFNRVVSSVSTDGSRLTPDAAAAALNRAANDETERRAVSLLLRALGIVPRGTVVRVASGALGVVVANAVSAEHFGLPIIELYETADGDPISGVVLDLSRPDEALVRWGGIAAVLRAATAPATKLASLRALDAADAAAAPVVVGARRPAYTPLDLHAVSEAGPVLDSPSNAPSSLESRHKAEEDLDAIMASYFESPSGPLPAVTGDTVRRAEHRLRKRYDSGDASDEGSGQLSELLSGYLAQTGVPARGYDSVAGRTADPTENRDDAKSGVGIRDTIPEMGASAADILRAHLSSLADARFDNELADTGELPKVRVSEGNATQDSPALDREAAERRLLEAARVSAKARRSDDESGVSSDALDASAISNNGVEPPPLHPNKEKS